MDAGREFGVVNEPEYRAKNPNGRVPTIEDQGVVSCGNQTPSAAISPAVTAG